MKPELVGRLVSGAALLALMVLVAAAIEPLNVRAADDTYQQVDHWGLPAGGVWGVMSAVGVDAKDNVFAFKRSDASQTTEPLSSKIMVFDSTGKRLRSWGENFVGWA